METVNSTHPETGNQGQKQPVEPKSSLCFCIRVFETFFSNSRFSSSYSPTAEPILSGCSRALSFLMSSSFDWSVDHEDMLSSLVQLADLTQASVNHPSDSSSPMSFLAVYWGLAAVFIPLAMNGASAADCESHLLLLRLHLNSLTTPMESGLGESSLGNPLQFSIKLCRCCVRRPIPNDLVAVLAAAVRMTVRAFPASLCGRDENGTTPLGLVSDWVIRSDKASSMRLLPLVLVEVMVETWSETCDIRDNDGFLPVHVAASCSNPVLCWWLDRFPHLLLSPTSTGSLYLHLALDSCPSHSDVALKRLIDRACDKVLLTSDHLGYFPLHVAFRCCSPTTISALMKRSLEPVRRVTSDTGNSCLHLLLDRCLSETSHGEAFIRIICELIERTPELSRMTNFNCELPLHIAASNPSCGVDVIEILVKSFPDAIRQVDENGNTPLHRFVCRDIQPSGTNLSAVRSLLGSCVEKSPAWTQNYCGLLPYHLLHGALPSDEQSRLGTSEVSACEKSGVEPSVSDVLLHDKSSLQPILSTAAVSSAEPAASVCRLILRANPEPNPALWRELNWQARREAMLIVQEPPGDRPISSTRPKRGRGGTEDNCFQKQMRQSIPDVMRNIVEYL